MFDGKNRLLRQHCINQSFAIWGLDEKVDIEAFILTGSMSNSVVEDFPLPQNLAEEVNRLIKQAVEENNGIVIVDLPDFPKRQVTTPKPPTT